MPALMDWGALTRTVYWAGCTERFCGALGAKIFCTMDGKAGEYPKQLEVGFMLRELCIALLAAQRKGFWE